MDALRRRIYHARTRRGNHVFIIVLRYLLGFAFLPAGLKKILGQPFTDPGNTGIFHDFLHVFLDTGFFYHFVGAAQLLAAFLLLTQRFATLGVLFLLPILTAILVFCWSTLVVPTAVVVTLMFCGTLLLVLWDIERWRPLFVTAKCTIEVEVQPLHPTLVRPVWEGCGWLILTLYLANTWITGEVYRPRGAEWHNPSFWVLLLIAVSPFGAAILDRRIGRRNSG